MKNNYEIRGDTATIFINKRNGEIIKTIIDLCDLERAMEFNGTWSTSFSQKTQSHYVIGFFRKEKGWKTKYGMTIPLARFLFGKIQKGLVVDHINHNTLDNRRSQNLRVVTETVNRNNRKPKAS